MADERDLLPGETELLRVHRHPVVIVRRTVLPVLLIAVVLVVLGVLAGGNALHLRRETTTLGWFVELVILIAALVYLDIQYIIWRSESLTVTDQRVLYRRGVFGRFSRSIGLGRVQDVSTAQGFLGRIFGYGTVEVESAARDGAEVFDHVPDPVGFRNVLFEQLHGAHGTAPQTW
ncbi:MAG: PH domain-containing protein [Candidatus Dormibacteria bacterium]